MTACEHDWCVTQHTDADVVHESEQASAGTSARQWLTWFEVAGHEQAEPEIGIGFAGPGTAFNGWLPLEMAEKLHLILGDTIERARQVVMPDREDEPVVLGSDDVEVITVGPHGLSLMCLEVLSSPDHLHCCGLYIGDPDPHTEDHACAVDGCGHTWPVAS